MPAADRPKPPSEQARAPLDRGRGSRNRDLVLRMRLAAGRSVLDLFHAEGKGKTRMDLALLQELKVAARHPALRAELRQALVEHYGSPVGAQEIADAPPWLRDPDMTPAKIVDLLLQELPED